MKSLSLLSILAVSLSLALATPGMATDLSQKKANHSYVQGIRVDVEAGPIWNNDHAKQRCPEVLADFLEANPGTQAKWTGHWKTTVEGQMSVCNLLITIK